MPSGTERGKPAGRQACRRPPLAERVQPGTGRAGARVVMFAMYERALASKRDVVCGVGIAPSYG